VNSQLGGRERENQPSLAGIHRRESKNISQQGAQDFSLGSIEKHLRANDRHSKPRYER